MTSLASRVLGWQLLFVVGIGSLLALLAPPLLLLKEPASETAGRALFSAVGAGGAVALIRNWWRLRRHRFVLRALALGSRAVEPFEMQDLSDEIWQVTLGWLVPPIVALATLATVFRPGELDLTTSASLALLGAVLVAAAALPLYVVVRDAFMRVIELASPDVMREVVQSQERSGILRKRIELRLLAAVATPVAFVAIGSTLVVSAHLRRADERQREETARALARSALESVPGILASAGLEDAVERAETLGFSALVVGESGRYRLDRRGGVVELFTPLDQQTARVRFSVSTVGVVSLVSLLVALLSVAAGAWLGSRLGRSLGEDLRIATRGVRLLGTEAVISGGTRVMRPARFRPVEELGRAIERLADRFRIFAQAQERAIAARERATRMRGLFFASVSHDLKSPLNAILGFAELVRQTERLSSGQSESLAVIDRRGRELLALIETILDAARVEAGQLTLVYDTVTVSDLFGESIAKGRDLGGERAVEVVAEIVESIPLLRIDRVRMGRALASFIGHALRTAERDFIRVRAAPSRTPNMVRIDVEAPSTRFSGRELEAMLNPVRQPGESPHRGLALGLGLARAVVELHGGNATVTDLGSRGTVFTIRFPTDRGLA
jgi:signal transduction histidine kinase